MSRTFALSIEALPEAVRNAVRIAYLLCRVVDTIEDTANMPAEGHEHLFDAFDGLMSGASADTSLLSEAADELGDPDSADVILVHNCGAVFRQFWSMPTSHRADIRGPVLRMSMGMRSYTRRQREDGRLRIRSIDDLERYCYYVAGTVGELLTALFLHHWPLSASDDPTRDLVAAAQGSAVAFGTGLQLVNILKDVGDDARRGACYIPEDLMRREGLDASSILDAGRRDAALRCLDPVIELAREQLRHASDYTRLWPPETAAPVRLFLIVPMVLALRTLKLIEVGGRDVLTPGRNPKVGREFVLKLLQRAHEATADPEAYERLLAEAVEIESRPERPALEAVGERAHGLRGQATVAWGRAT